MTSEAITRRRHFPASARLTALVLLLLLVGGFILRGASASAPAGGPASAVLAERGDRGGARVSLAEVFFIQRNPVTGRTEWLGSLIIWFLLALSAVNIAMMSILTWDNRRDSIAPDGLIGRASGLLRDRRAGELEDFTRSDQTYFGRVMHAALEQRAHGVEAMLRAAEDAGQDHALRRLRRIEPLNIVGNVSPMIGLFGTVYGMILAFQEIVAAGGTPDPVNLAAGIGTALVTTFWGLIVAIPALAAFALLRNRIDGLTAHASRRADRLIEQFGGPEGAA